MASDDSKSETTAEAHDVTASNPETFSVTPNTQSDIPEEKAAAKEEVTLAERNPSDADSATASTPSTPTRRRQRRSQKPRPKTNNNTPSPSPSPRPSLSPPTTTMPPPPLLICSLGNPGAAYAHTLHSAGHTLLQSLALHLQTPSFSRDRAYANGLVTRSHSASTPWTLFQTPNFMNESGKGVAAAYRTWSRNLLGGAEQGARIVVLHDELERPLGAVSLRDKQGLSARGHNGIKSCVAELRGVGFVRVGVGIGRPVSRDSVDVSRFVLRKMTAGEKGRIEGAAAEVLERLLAFGV